MTDDNKLKKDESPDEMRLLLDASNLLDRSKIIAHTAWLAGNGISEGTHENDAEAICAVVSELQRVLNDVTVKVGTARDIITLKQAGEAA